MFSKRSQMRLERILAAQDSRRDAVTNIDTVLDGVWSNPFDHSCEIASRYGSLQLSRMVQPFWHRPGSQRLPVSALQPDHLGPLEPGHRDSALVLLFSWPPWQFGCVAYCSGSPFFTCRDEINWDAQASCLKRSSKAKDPDRI